MRGGEGRSGVAWEWMERLKRLQGNLSEESK